MSGYYPQMLITNSSTNSSKTTKEIFQLKMPIPWFISTPGNVKGMLTDRVRGKKYLGFH